MSRWTEFLEDDGHMLSMSRLLMLMAFPAATYFTYRLNTENGLLYYLGAFVIGYLGGKGCDAWKGKPNDDNH